MKIVKMKCEKSNAKLIFQVSDNGSEVLGCYSTDDASYDAMQSEVRLNAGAKVKFACPTCGADKVGSCDHVYTQKRCSSGATCNKYCMTCKHLTAEYGRAKRRDCVQIKAGEVAQLELTNLKFGLGWDSSVDIDASIVLISRNSHDLVYFGDTTGPDGCVYHLGDNLTGRDGSVIGADDDENIEVYHDKVPAEFDSLVFVINIFTAGVASFLFVRGTYLNIYDQDTGDKLVEYKVGGKFFGHSSIIIGEARRTSSGWEFKAIGKGSFIKDVHALAEHVAKKYRKR